MSIKTIPVSLRKEYVKSGSFKLAMRGFEHLCGLQEPRLDQTEMLKDCFGAMRERFGRDENELDELTSQFGRCTIVQIFLSDIKPDERDPNSPLASVNAYAAKHLKDCMDCSRRYRFIETVRERDSGLPRRDN